VTLKPSSIHPVVSSDAGTSNSGSNLRGPVASPANPGSAARASTSPVSPHERSSAVKTVGSPSGENSEPEDDAVVAVPPTIEDGPPVIDEAAESAFLGEAKERGEVVTPKRATEVEETNTKALPPLNELVNKIPPDVREVLEDLFRARFVTVKRFPKKALKANQGG
jgi:hypothetical protein